MVTVRVLDPYSILILGVGPEVRDRDGVRGAARPNRRRVSIHRLVRGGGVVRRGLRIFHEPDSGLAGRPVDGRRGPTDGTDGRVQVEGWSNRVAC